MLSHSSTPRAPRAGALGVTSLLLALLAASAVADDGALTPERYVMVEHEVRQLTLVGMRERLEQQRAGASRAHLTALASQNRQRVQRVYAEHGTSAQAHARYGSRHAAEIEAFWEQHPAWSADLRRLQQELGTLASQFAPITVDGQE